MLETSSPSLSPFVSRGGLVRDISGLRFGRLVAKSIAGRNSGGLVYWSCVCDCGGSAVVSGANIRNGAVSSCGCLRLERSVAASVVPMVGKRFARLVVLERSGSLGRLAVWRCRCDCGGEKVTTGAKLRKGDVVSCGCALVDKPGLAPASSRAKSAARASVRRGRSVGAGGVFTHADVARIYTAQRGCCAWCSASLAGGFHRDHRVPLVLGGTNDASNIDLLCKPCNLKKGGSDPLDWAQSQGRLL